MSQLFHVEHIGRRLLRFQFFRLLLFEVVLDRCALVEKDYADCWLRDHVKGPFFSGKDLLEEGLVSGHAHLLNEGVDDLRIRLKRLPVLLLLLHW